MIDVTCKQLSVLGGFNASGHDGLLVERATEHVVTLEVGMGTRMA